MIGAKSWYRYVAGEDPRTYASGQSGEIELLLGYGIATPRASFIALIGPAFSESKDEGIHRSYSGAKIVLSTYATPTDQTMTYVSLTHSTVAKASLFQAKFGAKMPIGFYVGPEVQATWRRGYPFETHTSMHRFGLHVSSLQLGPWFLSLSAGWLRDHQLGSGGYLGMSLYGGF